MENRVFFYIIKKIKMEKRKWRTTLLCIYLLSIRMTNL